MKVLISENFIKNIPKEKEEFILLKLDKFIKELENKKYNIKNLSNGFSVWRIRGNENIYKFRVDDSNRVLFAFTSKINGIRKEFKEGGLLILDYCNHDEQIRRSKNLNVNIDYKELEEDLFDNIIDIKYKDYYFNSSTTISRIYNDKDLIDLIKEDSKEIIYYLSDEQDESLKSQTPLFLFGSAGSGKTTIGVRKIHYLHKTYNIDIGYFTYSQPLKKETEQSFRYLCESDLGDNTEHNIKFYDIYQYLKEINNRNDCVKFDEFKIWAKKKALIYYKENIDVFDIYREIRGIIKGMIGVDWTPSNQDIYSQKLLERDLYINLPSKFSTFSNKEIAYEIALKYQAWLDENKKVDENDLTRIAIRELELDNIEKYDFIVVDEVQDLTEKQIYLLYKLVKNPKNVLFSGDFNQTINATYFNTHRIKSLFTLNSKDIKFYEKKLSTNYRSHKEIVKLANRVSEIRINKLYRDKNDYKEKYIELEHEECQKPIFLKKNNTNRNQLLKLAENRHYTAIIVCDEYEKIKLKKDLGIEDNVFTVSEMKGIEKPYVICYNIVSKYNEQWKQILNGIEYNNEHLYRYYFNMFYVAITRARNYICFYEEEDCDLYNELEDFITYIDKFDEDNLKLNTLSTNDDYYREGIYLESKEKYEHAISIYKKSKKNGINMDIERCEAFILRDKGEYLEAANKLFSIKEYDLSLELYKAICNYEGIIKSMLLMDNSYEEIVSELKKYKIDHLDIIFKSSNDKDLTCKFYEKYDEYLEERLNHQIYNVDIIKESINSIDAINF